MKTINWIKRFFTPIKWETIWTGTMDGYLTNGETVKMAIIIRTNNKTNKYQCYATNGLGMTQDIEIEWLVTQYPEIIPTLNKHNIKY